MKENNSSDKSKKVTGPFRGLLERLTGKEGYDSFYYSSGKVIFLIDLLIGITIGGMVYTFEWSYLREKVVLFLIWFLNRFNYLINIKTFQDKTFLTGVLIDISVVTVSALLSAWFNTSRNKIVSNIVLAAAVLPVSYYLMLDHGIIVNSPIIIAVIILIISLNHYSDQKLSREKSAIVREKKSAEFGVVSHISHSVKPQVLIAKAPLMAVRQYLERQNLLEEALPNKMLNGLHETVGEALEKVIKTLNQINDVVGNARNLIGREISVHDFEEVDIRDIFEQEIKPLYSDRDFEIHATCSVVGKIRLHKASFVEAINNIIRNAETHAFPAGHQGTGHNCLSFRVWENVKYVFIDYTNNGLPFPHNLDAKAFLTFGKKSSDSPGEGLGGAWIGRVIEAHGGAFEIIRDGKPVHFKIKLPKRL